MYRANLNPPVLKAEHGKAASLDHAGRGHPNRKAGRQEQHWDGRRSQRRLVTNRICPRRSGLDRREKYAEPLQLGNCNRRATPVAWCAQSRCPQEHGDEWPQPGIAKWSEGIKMRSVRHPFSSGRGSDAWKGQALERFEPCEAKVSRTVLRGAWAG